MNVISSVNDKIYFNSFMTSLAFAKARFSERIREPGVLVKKTDGAWTFDSWSFESTTEDENENIILEGTAFPGSTLKSLISKINQSEEDKAKAVKACALVVSVIEEAFNWNHKLPEEGAGAIYISDDFSQLIFMPKLFFSSAVLCSKENIFAEEQGFYINENLHEKEALKFTQAVLAYISLCGEFPFSNPDRTERASDILDRNFIPAEIKIPGLKKNVAAVINSGLGQEINFERSKKSTAPKSKTDENFLNTHFPRSEFFEECGLTSEGEIPEGGKLFTVDRSDRINEEKFNKTAERSGRKREKRVNRKRWLRKRQTLLAIAGVAAVIIFGVGLSYYSSAQGKPTSKGLTSLETVNMYYTALNTLNLDQAKFCSEGSTLKSQNNLLGNLYISLKGRSMYDQKMEAKPLSKYLCYNQPSFNISGLSQFTVNGQQGKLLFEPQRKKEKPAALTIEDGIELKTGDTRNYTVSFFTSLTENMEVITVIPVKDEITLTYKNNRWLITESVRTSGEEQNYPKEIFTADYNEAFEKCGKDINGIMEILRTKYNWLPTPAEIDEAVYILENETLF